MNKNLIKSEDILEIYVDGACRKNPGLLHMPFYL